MWDWQSSSRLPAEGFKVPGARVMAVDSFTHASTTLKRLATWYDEISPTCHEFCQAGGGDLVDAKLIFAHVQPSSWCLAGGSPCFSGKRWFRPDQTEESFAAAPRGKRLPARRRETCAGLKSARQWFRPSSNLLPLDMAKHLAQCGRNASAISAQSGP